MRIGLVCPYSLDAPGGVQNHVLGLAGWLRAQGHEPAILAPGNITSAALARHGLGPTAVTSLGATIALRWNGSVARVSGGPRTSWRVRRWLTGNAFDVVHIHEPVTPSAALWAWLWARVPVVATFHLATERSRLLALAGRLLGPRLRGLNGVLAVSPVAAEVVRSHLHLHPIIVPNGIDVAEFAGSRSSRGGPPRLTFLGRLTDPRKGLAVLLAALPALRAAVGPCEVVVAGPGRATLPDDVVAAGELDDQRRAELLRGSDVLIAPHTHGESFGLVLAEAMAAGTQVVASALPAFVDVLTGVEGREFGRTFPIADPDALAHAVARTLDAPPATPMELQEQAKRFDWSRVGPQVMSTYLAAVRTQLD